ncbi:similar to Saccharomyces cerevisiae YKL057C NUP120 Subunit of the Nup84p subcomplex of the nuclear pore complex (NPC) [Maudiozyma saulgeensis]|uniref:Similar to Saccharomyces cerevisiae YKL057C NUP120 Subunit of the Nup84p subcomplex of the nuclear pore complex (NPC) n=1 Tax=Maudiozyma saulgeensis TaxID=1789683 RepID=A0A1X7R7W1_9SACH|nr:similar to Saccharomyces cerevisiae YKL057C NUP120 Subunit of the Nup84p subcomplex of the nuclear pore complex (NPC) [Kazachstania saulgeensis]
MPSLSKIDVNLLQFQELQTPANVVTLSLGNNSNINGTTLTSEQQMDIINNQSSYSNSIKVSDDNLLCYHLTQDCSKIIIYTTNNCINGKTIIISLPQKTMNKHNTLSLLISGETLLLHTILKDGLFLTMSLPLNYILDATNSINLGDDWVKVQNPYDFTIRVPHLLYPVSEELLMVFLNDGGLLGLRKTSEDFDLEPLLFNDNSYLQSFTKLFYKNQNIAGKVTSCLTFDEKFLIVLTENYYLKIWDIKTFSLLNEYNLSANIIVDDIHGNDIHQYNDSGNFLSIFQSTLIIYSPQKNGIFQIGYLSVDQTGVLEFNLKNIINASLPSSSIWFLSDMKLTKPIDLNYTSSYLNLVILWKSGSLSKFQILNILYDDLKDCQWIESSSKSLTDGLDDLDLACITQAENETDDELYDRCFLTLKSRFSPEVFKRALNILSENNIIITSSDNISQRKEYLANLETISKDIKGKMDEVSTLSIFNDELILVNSLTPFNHAAFKINTGLEYYYFNLHNSEYHDDLSKYLKALDSFTSTLPRHVMHTLGEKFLNISTGKLSKDLSPNEKFVEIFKSTLQNQFAISNLQLLMTELNNLDIPALLTDFIQNYLIIQEENSTFIETLTTNMFSKIATIESMYQMITIQNTFIIQILMTFVLLDSTYSYFAEQIEKLLEFNYKQLLFLELYKEDKLQLIETIFMKNTKYHQGAKFYNYSELNDFIMHNISLFYEEPITMNTYFLESIKKYILPSGKQNTIQETKMYLRNVGTRFYTRGNKSDELLLSISLFIAGEYEESYRFFQLHDGFSAINTNELPYFMEDMLKSEDSDSIWVPLIKTLVAQDHKQTRFYYYLSCLYSYHGNSPELALKSIKKSIEISMEDDTELDIVTKQHEQLLAMLVHFSIFDEVIDVLRLGHSFLSADERRQYFSSLLSYPNHNDSLFSTLINMSTNPDTRLELEDYSIVDSILSDNLEQGDWVSYKKLFTFRFVNKYEREAAEVIFNYWFKLQRNADARMKKRYGLIIINILSTFVNSYDQYILDGANVVTLDELRKQCIKL